MELVVRFSPTLTFPYSALYFQAGSLKTTPASHPCSWFPGRFGRKHLREMERQGGIILPCLWWCFWQWHQRKHQATWAPAALVAISAEVAMPPGAQQQIMALGLLPSSLLTSG